tara:strand:- start:11031 stop:11816 length:786 start_codon:yes stop_codon:yes gene_type:complete
MQLPVLKDKPTGIVVYRGPSQFDGGPIAAIATGFKRSKNPKTGKMIQIWIIRRDMVPGEAADAGEDESVCGSCKHRHFRSCYVNLGQGVWHVYHGLKNGIYKNATPNSLKYFAGQNIRLGAYGDPASVPIDIWDSICGVAAGWTGYTHAWRKSQHQDIKKYCMASADTEDEALLAMERGWKPFYVRQAGDPIPDKFFSCPAAKESGQRLSCSECKVCSGGEYREGQGMPTIIAHGPSWKRSYFLQGIKRYRQKKRYTGVFV